MSCRPQIAVRCNTHMAVDFAVRQRLICPANNFAKINNSLNNVTRGAVFINIDVAALTTVVAPREEKAVVLAAGNPCPVSPGDHIGFAAVGYIEEIFRLHVGENAHFHCGGALWQQYTHRQSAHPVSAR